MLACLLRVEPEMVFGKTEATTLAGDGVELVVGEGDGFDGFYGLRLDAIEDVLVDLVGTCLEPVGSCRYLLRVVGSVAPHAGVAAE